MSTEHPDLFDRLGPADPASIPLADRMRPRNLQEFVGQGHLVGQQRMLRRLIAEDRIPSMILWGPPGSGKTTLARIIAGETRSAFETLSATGSGVKDIRAVIERARRRRAMESRDTVLFIDEIHRFNKAQQDALLPHVEAGVCRLVGATTENPSFEVNSALLSRARVFQLSPLSEDDLQIIVRSALTDRERGLGTRELQASASVVQAIAAAARGDARRALNVVELAAELVEDGEPLTLDVVAQAVGQGRLRHDKAGEDHYNVVSAFIKSMRASDADASIYWLARMLEAGEDPMFVARRIVIFAAEDVGNADPRALTLANAAAQSTHLIGMPEAVLPLSQATLYMALAPKSNSALRAYAAARKAVHAHGSLPVPMEVRNAPTGLMREAGYGAGYRYPHDSETGVVPGHDSHLPSRLGQERYVDVSDRGWEGRAWARLMELRNRGRRD